MSEDFETETEETVEEVRDDLQDQFDEWYENDVPEDEMIENLHNIYQLSYPAAVYKLRVLKKAAGLTKPRGHKSEEVMAFIKESFDAGDDRSVTTEKLIEKYDYTKHSAASTYSTLGKKLGIVTGGGVGGTKQPLDQVVAFVRQNADKKRADFCTAMAEELGYSESTAGAFYTYIPFAKEYAKQEMEAAGYKTEAA